MRTEAKRRLALAIAATTCALTAAPAHAAVPASCGGPADASFTGHQTFTGEFDSSLQGSYVMVPFDVAAGTTGVRVRYCWDQPDLQIPGAPVQLGSNTLDLGVYGARSGPGASWGGEEFRGQAGSSIRDVTIAPNGFSSEAAYVASRKGYVHGRTTRGYVPGPIDPGQWAVELGLAAIATQAQGDADGKVAWRVEVETTSDPAFASDPYTPTPYDPDPVQPATRWYAGDFHVHGEHEPGNTLMHETLDYAFQPKAQGGAGLDFATIVDHNNVDSYDEIGAIQPDYPGHMIGRSTEVTTYRGHLQNHASGSWVDYRTGPVLERASDGSLSQLRGTRPASTIFGAIQGAGGYTQINHPTIFPSAVPGFSNFCRGCPWDYSDAETDYSKVDAIEVATGPAGLVLPPLDPGPNPFTPLALFFYDHAIGLGNHIAAVGGSDSHHGSDTGDFVDSLTTSPDGVPATMVLSEGLSEKSVQAGVQAGHSYVKLNGVGGPDLRFEATADGRPSKAIMGDTVKAAAAQFTATISGAGLTDPLLGPYVLLVFKDGLPLIAAPVLTEDFTFQFPSILGPGAYRLQLMRLGGGASISALSSPIYLDPNAPDSPPPPDPGPDPNPGPGGGSGGGGQVARPDAVYDGSCTSLTAGTKRADLLSGGPGGDFLSGLRGRDRIKGRGGNDCLYGGGGQDRINAGPGADKVFGGPGSDRIATRDGLPDRVDCGPGKRDRVRADRADALTGCERIKRV